MRFENLSQKENVFFSFFDELHLDGETWDIQNATVKNENRKTATELVILTLFIALKLIFIDFRMISIYLPVLRQSRIFVHWRLFFFHLLCKVCGCI